MPQSLKSEAVDPIVGAAQLLSRIGLIILGIALPIISLETRRLIFVLMPIGAALIVAGALLYGIRPSLVTVRQQALHSSIAIAALALFGWALLSFAWTPYPAEALPRIAKVLGTVALTLLAACCLPQQSKASNLYLLSWGLAAAAIIAIGLAWKGPEILRQSVQGDESTLGRGVIGLNLMLWPILAGLSLRGRVGAGIGLAIIVAAAIACGGSLLSGIGMAISLAAFAMAVQTPRRTGKIIGVLAAGLVMIAPVLPLLIAPFLPSKGFLAPNGPMGPLVRGIQVWRDIVEHDGLRLLTGHGYDTANRAVTLQLLPFDTPGSNLFELWYELGIVGVICMAFIVFQAYRLAGKMHATIAPFVIALLTSVFVMSAIGLAASQLWWLTLLGAIAILTTHVLRALHVSRRPLLWSTKMGAKKMAASEPTA